MLFNDLLDLGCAHGAETPFICVRKDDRVNLLLYIRNVNIHQHLVRMVDHSGFFSIPLIRKDFRIKRDQCTLALVGDSHFLNAGFETLRTAFVEKNLVFAMILKQ